MTLVESLLGRKGSQGIGGMCVLSSGTCLRQLTCRFVFSQTLYIFTGMFTEAEELRIGGIVSKSITVGSGVQYKRHWNKWKDYLGTVEPERRPQMFLQDVMAVGDKVKRLVLFVAYLRDIRGVIGSKPLGGVMSGVRFHWKQQGLDSAFFDDAVLLQAKKGGRETTDELREEAWVSEGNALIPAFVEMVIQMRVQLWEQTGVDAEGLDCKGTYIAAVVSFDSGFRPCTVTLKDGPKAEDHCIRANEFRFLVVMDGEERWFLGGEEIRGFLVVDFHVRLGMVMSVDIVVLTGKTQHRASFSREARTIGRESAFEALTLEDLCQWMVVSRVLGKDEFVARYAPVTDTRKVVTRKQLCNAVKEACVAFDLPPARFSAKSLRSGFATHMTVCGITRDDMVARAGWSGKSKVPDLHYIKSYVRGAMATAVAPDGGVTGLGVAGARRMLMKGSSVSRR